MGPFLLVKAVGSDNALRRPVDRIAGFIRAAGRLVELLTISSKIERVDEEGTKSGLVDEGGTSEGAALEVGQLCLGNARDVLTASRGWFWSPLMEL